MSLTRNTFNPLTLFHEHPAATVYVWFKRYKICANIVISLSFRRPCPNRTAITKIKMSNRKRRLSSASDDDVEECDNLSDILTNSPVEQIISSPEGSAVSEDEPDPLCDFL
ncbi:uncharacterized protein LOC127749472 isoform X1 [Frankliniella occidentalis]|uniref:Uncharacterized protein LOC127749472 isoform X1 n=2 Tax=Frankliniella occidentalis TaxID=133901 RepID=A0A9C6U9T1_FRAOC|nr:uncharacterized protein LOC127749472 isoform X1 [Frankliniella occidentalis]